MALPSIDPSEVGLTGLIWLFLSYGYALYSASKLIGEGSELLLLVPSMAGLVGGIVLPVLGAIPDGAIILFSGLGPIDEAQESLSVGVGALAGSTIMLLTVSLAVSIIGGRVDISDAGIPNYTSKPKLTSPKTSIRDEFLATGVVASAAVKKGGVVMALTTVPFFLIQIPAIFIHGPLEEVAESEKWWALFALVICLVGLVAYMKLQLSISREGRDQEKRVASMKKVLHQGKMSLSGALGASILLSDHRRGEREMSVYDSMDVPTTRSTTNNNLRTGPSPDETYDSIRQDFYREVLSSAFNEYDTDRNGYLDKQEVYRFFLDYHEIISREHMDELFHKFDRDNSGALCLQEFVGMAHYFITERERQRSVQLDGFGSLRQKEATKAIVNSMWSDGDGEEEEVPDEFTDLPPDQQQRAIKARSFFMLTAGTLIVFVFSDPMVDVMQEIAVRAELPPFYVAFVLAPIATSASEVVTSYFYASKKTRKSISVSLTALEGAASMNNTLCLSIFMGLIAFRNLAWEYTAETVAILVVEFIIAALVQRNILTTLHAVFAFALFPLSFALVAAMEAMGLN